VKDNGTYIRYKKRSFQEEAMKIIHSANLIIAEYEKKNLKLTVRQLYYQFVARGLIPNTSKNYGLVKGAVSEGRLAGLISWTAIEDRTRNLRGLQTWDSPEDYMLSIKKGYVADKWANQPFRFEAWIEKDALVGVIGSICLELGINYFACRGYNSQSEQWRAGQRFARYIRKGQRPIVLHLGDHDPSGIDMTRDNQERLQMFTGVPVQVIRLALNMDQVEQYKPPNNPAKTTDSRASDYIAEFGTSSWELDALDPEVIRNLIADCVKSMRDETLWDRALKEEAEEREVVEMMVDAGIEKVTGRRPKDAKEEDDDDS
jgi:hypothetical protein